MSVAAVVVRNVRRMPDFAGVALVDILANGVAMLVILVVLSISARTEREARYAEQTSEIAAVMSHKFSTSLVLNSLAASRPARLHDYETSPLDRNLDPAVLPILELHPRHVREFHSGAIWTRRELLEERNGLGAWVAGFSDAQRHGLRIDVYDVAQFYLAMSILREHGIRVYHWHFLAGALSPDEAARCPPGVAAKDCPRGESAFPAPLPTLARDERTSGGLSERDSLRVEPPDGPGDGDLFGGNGAAAGLARGGQRFAPGPVPDGAVPGRAGSPESGFGSRETTSGALRGRHGLARGNSLAGGGGRNAGGEMAGKAEDGRGLLSESRPGDRTRGFGSEPRLDPGTAAGLGSFPNALEGGSEPSPGRGATRMSRGAEGGDRVGGRSRAGVGAGTGAAAGGPRFNLRIALPERLRRAALSGNASVRTPALETLFGIILQYLGELQGALDSGGTPSRLVDGFADRIQRAFRSPPALAGEERRIARDLARVFALAPELGDPTFRPDPLPLRPAAPGADAVLVIETNRLIDELEIGLGAVARGEDSERGDTARAAPQLPEWGRADFALNAYPGVWKGLEVRIEPYSVLVVPPGAREPGRTRWRAAAYVTPALDEFIVGFAFASQGADGTLRLQADANRVRLDGRPLFTAYRESAFGSRGWLVSLYAALAVGLVLIAASRRPLARRRA